MRTDMPEYFAMPLPERIASFLQAGNGKSDWTAERVSMIQTHHLMWYIHREVLRREAAQKLGHRGVDQFCSKPMTEKG